MYLFSFGLCWVLLLRLGFLWLWGVGITLVALHGLLSVGAPLIAGHRLYSLGFRSCGTQLSCPKGCGIFLNLGLNWCPLHWQGILKTAGPPGKFLARGLSLTSPIPTMCMLDAQSVLS